MAKISRCPVFFDRPTFKYILQSSLCGKKNVYYLLHLVQILPNITEKKPSYFPLPFDTVSAGDHCDLSISRQILPLLLILGWYIFVVKATYKKTEQEFCSFPAMLTIVKF